MLLRLSVIVLFLVVIPFASPAFAERKVALIIGNGAYEQITELVNPLNDANAATDILMHLGFETTSVLNGDKSEMEAALQTFQKASAGADAALIYFAGHGIQVDNQNYLLGVKADGETLERVKEDALHMDQLVAGFGANIPTKLLLLDACRNNPFEEATRSLGGSAEPTRGLARANHTVEDLLVVYSAQPSKVALDGAGENSPFMEALTQALGSQDEVRLNDALIDITNRVRTKTRGRQIPYIEGSLTRNLTFSPQSTFASLTPATVQSCEGSTASLSTPFNTDEKFTDLPGQDANILINNQVNICIEDDRVKISGPFSETFDCAAFLNEEGIGYYFTDTTGEASHVWLYADPSASPALLEFGLYRGEEELQWIATNRAICR